MTFARTLLIKNCSEKLNIEIEKIIKTIMNCKSNYDFYSKI